MRAYKFLDAEGNAPFMSAPWVPGEWVESPAVAICREGVHACGAADLSYWLASSLWEIELDGEIVESRRKVVAQRGRLVHRIDAYGAAVRELAELGAWRCRDRAVTALRSAGDDDLAAAFSTASTLEDLIALRESVDDASFARTAAALAVDAAHFARHGQPAQSPFVAACSAGHAAAGPEGDQGRYDAAYEEERDQQSLWLRDRLALS